MAIIHKKGILKMSQMTGRGILRNSFLGNMFYIGYPVGL